MTPLDWSVDPRDWSRPGVTSIVGNIMRNTRTGSIILEHDGGDRSETVAMIHLGLRWPGEWGPGCGWRAGPRTGRSGPAATLSSHTGCSAAWLARRVWVAEAAGSNPASPTSAPR